MGNHEFCTICDASDFHSGEPCHPRDLQLKAERSERGRKTAPYDFGGTLGSSGAFTHAELNGEVVVLPLPNQLLIDIDDEVSWTHFNVNITKVHEYIGVLDQREKPSRSGDPNRRHITVDLYRDVTPMERILLQAVLGSDLRRELLSYCRITIDDPHPTLFLEKGQLQIDPGKALVLATDKA